MLPYANRVFKVKGVSRVNDVLIHYQVDIGDEDLTLIDADFEVFKNGEWVYENKPILELYKDIPVYLCLDSSGGMSDRLCIGDQALIDNANATIEVWNNFSDITEEYTKVTSVAKAIEVLSDDNFEVIEIKPNTVHIAENYIITDNDINVYNDYRVFSPKDIYKKAILKSAESNCLIDLTVALDKIKHV